MSVRYQPEAIVPPLTDRVAEAININFEYLFQDLKALETALGTLVTAPLPAAGIALSTGSAWGTSITNNSANWNTAYGWGNFAAASTFIGTTSVSLARASGALALSGVSIDGNAGTVTGLSVVAGQTLTVTTGGTLVLAGFSLTLAQSGTLGTAAYTASTAYLGASATAVDSDKLDGQHGSYYAVSGGAPAAHALIDAIGHTASGLTTGHFLKATGATTYGFAAHGLTYTDVGADAAGAAAAITLSGLGGQPQLNGTGFVKASGTTISYDNSTYLTSVTAHNVLSTTHGDATTGSATRGDLITAQGVSPTWTRLAFPGTPTGKCLVATVTDVAWSAAALGTAAWAATGDFDASGAASGAVSTHASLTTGIHGLAITAGQTLTVTTGGTLGTAAYTAATAYDAAGVAAGAVSTHAALTTGIHGLAITAGQTLTVTTGGTLGSAAYTASTAYDVAGAAAAITLAGLGGQPALNGTGYVKMSGTTVSYDATVLTEG
ncbi:MAG: hypothetical protein WC718_13050 [Phycisphaerales bacterium]|jgi:filamentous hemagglutinin